MPGKIAGPSIVVTVIVRKEVAVGTERLSSM